MATHYVDTAEAQRVANELTVSEEGERDAWTYMVENSTGTPAQSCIRMYNENGEFVTRWDFDYD